MKLSFKHLFGGVLLGFVLFCASFVSLPDGKLHLVFCDVGQGDAIYIRTPQGEDILMDGGPNDKVLTCLGSHMPFYDRTIEIMILSHPQADHLNGLISVLERYSVDYFVSSGIGSGTEGYQKLVEKIKNPSFDFAQDKKIKIKNIVAGEKISLDNITLATIWPTSALVASIIPGNQSNVLGDATSEDNVNESSLVLKLTYGGFSALLTGDADSKVQPQISPISFTLSEAEGLIAPIEVLKVPHHGSKTGMTDEFLKEIKPQLAVISVGKNSYGHPHPSTIQQLNKLTINTLRTDLDGEIEIVSDGKEWYTKTK